MKTSIIVCSIVLALFAWSCSESVSVNNVGTPDVNVAGTPDVSNAGTPAKKLSSNSEDAVLSDGQDQTKKSGWQAPRPDKREIVRTSVHMRPTEKGKEVEVTSRHYSYEPPWSYSEDFLDLRGPLKLESHFIMEHSIKGKVFMYSIFAKKVVVLPPSNYEPHEDTFVYLILDKDGDGIFETLLRDNDEIIVPNWVLK